MQTDQPRTLATAKPARASIAAAVQRNRRRASVVLVHGRQRASAPYLESLTLPLRRHGLIGAAGSECRAPPSNVGAEAEGEGCLLYTSPSPRDRG
eukprot:704627-Rhodomonas_salina.1